MKQRSGSIWLFMAKAVMFFVVLGVFFVGQIIFYEQTLFYFWGNYIVILLYAAYLYFLLRIYQALRFGSRSIPEIILAWILCLLVANILQYLMLSLLEDQLLSLLGFVIVFIVQIILVIPLIIIIDKLYYSLNPVQKALIIYANEIIAQKYSSIIKKHHKKFEISDIISQEEPEDILNKHINESDSVFFLDINETDREKLLELCFLRNKRVYILPTFTGIMLNTAEISWISDTPMFLPKNPEPDLGTRLIKRCMDIVISLVAIIALSWLMVITWGAIILYDRHNAIYKQVRITKGGKLFTIYKFRSMIPDAEDDGVPRLTSRGDTRITPIGRIIRTTRLDELPQLFNVLSGAMSLVGPRPERPEIAEQYEQMYPNFPLRTKVKAGITGFAQIHGRYNTAPDEKLFLDLMYIESFSIWQDLKLILQTLPVLFKPSSTEGVAEDAVTAIKHE